MMPNNTQRGRKREQGQALVEFSLILPILLYIIFGVFDYGRILLTFAQSSNQLRAATRTANVLGTGGTAQFLECGDLINIVEGIFWTNDVEVTVVYLSDTPQSEAVSSNFYYLPDPADPVKAPALGSCDNITNARDVPGGLSNGDILRIHLNARIDFMTPILSALIPHIDIEFATERTIVAEFDLGSSGCDSDFDTLCDDWELSWFGCLDENDNRIDTWYPTTGLQADILNQSHYPGGTCETLDSGTMFVPYLAFTATDDPDGDGLPNSIEQQLGTDPRQGDGDGDCLLDLQEAFYATDPNNPDTDGDGLLDGHEVDNDSTLRTPPCGEDYPIAVWISNTAAFQDADGDSDHDGPADPDSDGDSLNDLQERNNSCEPLLEDTDGDGISDYDEINGYAVTYKVDGVSVPPIIIRTSCNNDDDDGDGVPTRDELLNEMNPNSQDTDGDGLLDGDEYNGYTYSAYGAPIQIGFTSPLGLPSPTLRDSDGDFLTDGDERDQTVGGSDETNPANPDTDGDGLLDGEEVLSNLPIVRAVNYQTDPADPATCSTTTPTERVYDSITTSPIDEDSDNDGLPDGDELNIYFTNPEIADTDGDGVDDKTEVDTGGGAQARDCANGATVIIDDDGDNIDDGWVQRYFIDPGRGWDPATSPDEDFDGDGLSNRGEFEAGSEPDDPNSDKDDGPTIENASVDGLTAFELAAPAGSEDELLDGEEVSTANGSRTSPLEWTSDNDSLSDSQEVDGFLLTSFFVNGLDRSGRYFTNPTAEDTDQDGIDDDDEVFPSTTSPVPYLTDGANTKGGVAASHTGYRTDPTRIDTDGDGIADGAELTPRTIESTYRDEAGVSQTVTLNNAITAPHQADTDGDTLTDSFELANGLNPLDDDSDDDMLTDATESRIDNNAPFTDLLDADSDADGLTDGEEYNGFVFRHRVGPSILVETLRTNPNSSDTDGDGLDDSLLRDVGSRSVAGYEVPANIDGDGQYDAIDNPDDAVSGTTAVGSDPRFRDTDGDSFSDAGEVNGEGNNDPLIPSTTCTDLDNDTLTSCEEATVYGTDPDNPDTDGDGLRDDYEVIPRTLTLTVNSSNVVVNNYTSDPVNCDTDDDGIIDSDEEATGGNTIDVYTMPQGCDNNGDGVLDAAADSGVDYLDNYVTHPSDEDTDNDAISDLDEYVLGTNPIQEEPIVPALSSLLVSTSNNSILQAALEGWLAGNKSQAEAALSALNYTQSNDLYSIVVTLTDGSVNDAVLQPYLISAGATSQDRFFDEVEVTAPISFFFKLALQEQAREDGGQARLIERLAPATGL